MFYLSMCRAVCNIVWYREWIAQIAGTGRVVLVKLGTETNIKIRNDAESGWENTSSEGVVDH